MAHRTRGPAPPSLALRGLSEPLFGQPLGISLIDFLEAIPVIPKRSPIAVHILHTKSDRSYPHRRLFQSLRRDPPPLLLMCADTLVLRRIAPAHRSGYGVFTDEPSHVGVRVVGDPSDRFQWDAALVALQRRLNNGRHPRLGLVQRTRCLGLVRCTRCLGLVRCTRCLRLLLRAQSCKQIPLSSSAGLKLVPPSRRKVGTVDRYVKKQCQDAWDGGTGSKKSGLAKVTILNEGAPLIILLTLNDGTTWDLQLRI
ncbi:hypothetical protein B0H17DRAFT_1194625 [Mycena rosella]|uniref:Uncharacterized protein n=1 Tax=Mycena rosella TaxID=1033263 RepID=A0AAD7E1M9_MYCRO|nr:hypothetical protein B0H17DRAFT_1194625 [Mycena rosella]